MPVSASPLYASWRHAEAKMDLVAPNLAALIGEIIGARLISHAGGAGVLLLASVFPLEKHSKKRFFWTFTLPLQLFKSVGFRTRNRTSRMLNRQAA